MGQHVLRYLRDCYQTDHARSSLLDIHQSSVSHLSLLSGKEMRYTGELDSVPIPGDHQALVDAAFHYRKERDLVHGSLILVGTFQKEEAQFVCAPLVLESVNAQVDEDQVTWFCEEAGSRRINHGLLRALNLDDNAAALSSGLWHLLGQGPLDQTRILHAVELLEDVLPGCDCTAAFNYPELMDPAAFKKVVRAAKRAGTCMLLPVSFLGLIKRGVEARGVLTELEQMAGLKQHSAPVAVLFRETLIDVAEPERAAQMGLEDIPLERLWQRIPAILSEAQRNIVENACHFPVSMVIGPPGTGKSFTIAALAVEHMARGARVLVVSKMDHAVDVVAEKIEALVDFKVGPVRGGRGRHLKRLKEVLEELTRNQLKPMHLNTLRAHQRKLERCCASLAELETELHQHFDGELVLAERLVAEPTKILDKIRGYFLRRKLSKPQPSPWKTLDTWTVQSRLRLQTARVVASALIDRHLADRIKNNRREFRSFLKGIRARTGARQEQIFGEVDFDVILGAFPVWLVNLAHVSDVLPFTRELFDLVIVDEASQCDMASILPALHRAKRAIFVGDPQQLRHISFVSRERQHHFARKYNLLPEERETFDYPRMSILDLVNDYVPHGDQVVFLDEYYRGEPPLIAFSNQRFYGNQLSIMTQKPNKTFPDALKWVEVAGRRLEDGVNRAEVARVVEDVVLLLEPYQDQADGVVPSIGVLSPFRAQVDALTEAFSQKIPMALLKRANLLVATAHGFQGEERDYMFLSLALDKQFHGASLRFLEQDGVFNVSITRARIRQTVYSSVDPSRLPKHTLLRHYLAHLAEPYVSQPSPGRRISDGFARDVAAQLKARGFKVLVEQPCLGLVVDMVIVKGGKSLLLDLIGYPGEYKDFVPLARYRMLVRAGLNMFPLLYSLWMLHQERTLGEILEAHKRL